MALTPEEKLQRRLTDPYFGLAEKLAKPSLLDQKKMSLAAANVEKKREQDPAQSLADEAQGIVQDETDLLDIAESSLFQGASQLKDFFTGAPARTNVEIQREADIRAGVTPEGRRRLVEEPQQEVIQSLAAGDYLGAIPEAIAAGPGTLAESAVFIPELAVGALGANVGGRALLRRRGQKAKEGAERLFERVGQERKALAQNVEAQATGALEKAAKAIPKAAGQVSIATADLTQRQINDFRELHGVDPTREEAATMYAINLATMLPQPSILKNLFVPKFKKEIGREIRTLGKNIIGGSNARNVAARVVDGTKKVVIAAGAEAGQEYFQTWAENLNVQMGPEERKNFFESAMEIFGDEENQLQALAGSYLGGGAGGTARAGITVPAVAAGTAVDTAKGTVKTGAKLTKQAVGSAGRLVQKGVNVGTYKVLSQEEREVIRSEFESRKEIVDAKVSQFETAIDTVKGAKTLEELRADPEVAAVVSARQQKAELTDTDLENRKTLERLKADVIRSYRGDIGLLKTELQASNVADIATQAGKNVVSKSVETAKEAMDAIAPGVDAVVAEVKQFGDQAVKAVRELRSSTALGMIELAATAGKKESDQIVEAAKSLSLDDLQRTASVISDIKPDLARSLQRVIDSKQKALERTGLRRKTVVNEETLDPVIADVAQRGSINGNEAAAVSSALNAAVASRIEDKAALDSIMSALKAVEQSDAFKTQSKGAMSRDNMVVLKRKLERVRERLDKEPSVKEKAVKTAKKATEAVKKAAAPVAKKAAEKVAAKAAPKIKVSDTFRTVVEAVTETIKKPGQADALVKAAPDFTKQMKRFGVKTRSDFLAFVEEFPDVQNNIEFFKAIEQDFPTDISAREVMDNLSTIGLDSIEAIKKAYNDMNPPECKV